jgi:hypothetical protein
MPPAQGGYSQEVSVWNYCHVSHWKRRSFISGTISTYRNYYYLESWAFASRYFSAVLSRGSILPLLGIVEGLMHMAQPFQSSATEDMVQENKVP